MCSYHCIIDTGEGVGQHWGLSSSSLMLVVWDDAGDHCCRHCYCLTMVVVGGFQIVINDRWDDAGDGDSGRWGSG